MGCSSFIAPLGAATNINKLTKLGHHGAQPSAFIAKF